MRTTSRYPGLGGLGRSGLLLAAGVAVTLAGGARAEADILSVDAELHAGGAHGFGISGDQKASAFYVGIPAPAYGVELDAEVLMIDVWVRHHQFYSSKRIATWTAFATGLDTEIDFSATKKHPHRGSFLDLGVYVGFGMGTGQQVEPPLDAAQITDKGFFVEGRLGFGTHLGRFFDLGVVVPAGGGYYFKSGPGAVVNDTSNHYQAAQVEALLFLRMRLKAK